MGFAVEKGREIQQGTTRRTPTLQIHRKFHTALASCVCSKEERENKFLTFQLPRLLLKRENVGFEFVGREDIMWVLIWMQRSDACYYRQRMLLWTAWSRALNVCFNGNLQLGGMWRAEVGAWGANMSRWRNQDVLCTVIWNTMQQQKSGVETYLCQTRLVCAWEHLFGEIFSLMTKIINKLYVYIEQITLEPKIYIYIIIYI